MSEKTLTVGKINFNNDRKFTDNFNNCVSISLPNTYYGWEDWIYDKLWPTVVPQPWNAQPVVFYNNVEDSKFPKYDVYYNNDKTLLIFDFALAGYHKSEMQVEFKPENRVLTIEVGTFKVSDYEAEISLRDNKNREYVTNGISKRAFIKTFNIGLYFEPKETTFKDGLLKIVFEKILPSEKQPKILEIK